jgi:hypothetical protein
LKLTEFLAMRDSFSHSDEVGSLARYRPPGRPTPVPPSDGVTAFIAGVPLLDTFTVKRQNILEPRRRGLTFCCTEDDVAVRIHAPPATTTVMPYWPCAQHTPVASSSRSCYTRVKLANQKMYDEPPLNRVRRANPVLGLNRRL